MPHIPRKRDKTMISIDPNLCSRCGKCQTVCPAFIPTVQHGATPRVFNEKSCIGCGHCVDVCPTGAFVNDRFPTTSVHKVAREKLPSPESLLELIRSRRSNRTITSTPIPESSLKLILEAACYAPTAENSRKVHLHLITSHDDLHEVEKATLGFFTRLAKVMLWPPMKMVCKPFLRKLYDEVPTLMLMKKQFSQGEHPSICNATALLVISAPKGYDFGFQDCNLAYQNASLMAETLGVSQIYLGFVQTAMFMMGSRKAGRILGIPKGHKPFAIMALGMPAFRYGKYVERPRQEQ